MLRVSKGVELCPLFSNKRSASLHTGPCEAAAAAVGNRKHRNLPIDPQKNRQYEVHCVHASFCTCLSTGGQDLIAWSKVWVLCSYLGLPLLDLPSSLRLACSSVLLFLSSVISLLKGTRTLWVGECFTGKL